MADIEPGVYTYDQVFQASLEYFNNDELAAKVFVDKYALRDGEDNLLEKTPEDMHRRIAKEIAKVEKDKFKKPYSEEEIYY
ncbi:MAG TPA: ribonucleotide reductase N-terminal alpha domain-containing protein, partial [Candidatus Paceibacterota bacterium]|nr:ribonucleotide reductase N-terminal alpha domain-containing protein [Candidatus Paceibacterota bacterium]